MKVMKVLPLPRKAVPRALVLALSSIILSLPLAQACTRLTYLGSNQSVITARSMDWKTDVATHLWLFPQGMQRNGEVGANSPTFDEQLALNAYWKSIGGTVMLPGTNRAADRFARASFPKDESPQVSLASVFSVIRNVSVPYGISTPGEPNISSTRWRTVVDHQRKLYFFESALTRNTFWVDLKKIDFASTTGQVKKLDLGKGQSTTYSGDFKVTPAFKFQGA
ncbi:linear amide C-N hydrolase [Pseudomonas protegens]|uniref:linear amide C-N hydrolase n=1 Tax=Pseudomonas protegens TaxID=380021 RepID=UPI0035CCD293